MTFNALDGPAGAFADEFDAGGTSKNRRLSQTLSAACELFLASGFDAVTMDMVARAAGVSKATVYVYFASKEDLFAAVMIDEARRLSERIWTPGEGADDIERVLCRVARNFFEVFMTERSFAFKRVILGAIPRFPAIGRIVFELGPAKVGAEIATFLAAAHAGGRLDVPDPHLAASQFMSLLRSDVEVRGLLSMPPPSPAEINGMIDAAIAMFLARHGRNHAGAKP